MGFNVRSCLLGMPDTQVEVGGAREPANRILQRLPGYPAEKNEVFLQPP